MRRLPLALIVLALSAQAEEPPVLLDVGEDIGEADTGVIDAGEADAGVIDAREADPRIADAGGSDAGAAPIAAAAGADAGAPPPAARSGRHFAFLWDSEVPSAGASDVQLWLTPRWGREQSYTAVDLRGGVMQGICKGFAAGFFLDATPAATGVAQAQSIDARLTALGHVRLGLGQNAGVAAQPSVSIGPSSVGLQLLVAADASVGPVRIGANADLFHDIGWQGHPDPNTRARQGLGLAYVLSNGFTAGLEASNHLTWHRGEFRGMAFLIGPAVGYRGERLWFTASLLPQVAAVKPEARRGVGDPLELTDNERFSLRFSLGVRVP